MTRYCNRCGRPRPSTDCRCPACGAQEFSTVPHVTYDGWLRRLEARMAESDQQRQACGRPASKQAVGK